MDTESRTISHLPDTPLAHPGPAEPKERLAAVLGPWSAIALVVGYVIGSGIFVKPGGIAAEMGDFRWIITAWIFGGVLCLLGGFCFAELAVMLPRAGGLYVYLRAAFGPLTGFLFGWCEILLAKPASTGALSIIFAESLTSGLGWEVGTAGHVVLALVVIAAISLVNIRGVLWGSWVQNSVTAVKVGILTAIATLPLLLIAMGSAYFSVANYSTTVAPPADASFAARFGTILLAILWAYNGWHGITPVAEELRNPQKHIVWALVGGIGLLIVLYVAANVTYHGVLSMPEVAASKNQTAVVMLGKLLGSTGISLMAVVIMISTFGAINSEILITPRVSFAMGRDGVFFEWLGRVHATHRTPSIAILMQAVLASILVVGTGILVEMDTRFQQRSVFELLTNLVVFASSIFYLLGVLAVPVLRWTRPEWSRPYRTFGYPLTPILYAVSYVWFLYQVYLSQPLEARLSLVLIAIGVPVYFGYTVWRKRQII